MAYQNVEVIQKQKNHEKTWFKRFVGAVGATSVLAVSSAHAAGLEGVGTAITGQITSAETIITTVLIAAITVTALIIGYKKINAGAKAA